MTDHRKKIGCVQHDCDECQKREAIDAVRLAELKEGLAKATENIKTLRDEFAMAAMQGYLSAGVEAKDETIAAWCYKMADAMLEARKVGAA